MLQNIKKNIRQLIFLFFLVGVLIAPYFAFATAEDPLNKLKDVGGHSFAEANETTVSSIAGTVVATALSLLGVIFLILMVYAGILWMTAQGEESKIEKAKNIIKNSIIGIIILMSATAIFMVVSRIIIPSIK